MTSDKQYWNQYYVKAEEERKDLPSQFATFFLGEIGQGSNILELGCGNGRDSLFFAEHGSRVTGLDSAESAIEFCNTRARARGLDGVNFMTSDLGRYATYSQALAVTDEPFAAYARFFLHSLSEEQETEMLRGLASFDNLTFFGLEFRTNRDENLSKVTGVHFRRYVKPANFLVKASSFGFETVYYCEGFGYAKYLDDDAHVARVLLRKM